MATTNCGIYILAVRLCKGPRRRKMQGRLRSLNQRGSSFLTIRQVLGVTKRIVSEETRSCPLRKFDRRGALTGFAPLFQLATGWRPNRRWPVFFLSVEQGVNGRPSCGLENSRSTQERSQTTAPPSSRKPIRTSTWKVTSPFWFTEPRIFLTSNQSIFRIVSRALIIALRTACWTLSSDTPTTSIILYVLSGIEVSFA